MAWFRVDSDVSEGDQLIDKNDVTYLVREVVTKDYGINQHKQVILVEFNA